MDRVVFQDKVDGKKPNKNPINTVKYTKNPSRLNQKGQTIPRKPQNMMLRIKLIIKMILLVPFMGLGKIWSFSRSCRFSSNL